MRKTALLAVILTGAACSSGTVGWNYPWKPLPAQVVTARIPERPISETEARHLLRRAGFGVATPAEVDSLKGLDYESAVDKLLDGMRQAPITPVPAWVKERQIPGGTLRTMSLEAQNAYRDRVNLRRREIKEWWAGEMLATDSPLTEHMTLFWHNHFTTAMKKVQFAPYMYEQNALFRREAAGNFAKLLHDVSKQPAMLIWLDNRDNQERHPNENFARELLELFTLGEGHGYTEQDVREAARALTGWRFNDDGVFQNVARYHDGGSKTVLGQTGRFDGDEVLDIILRQYRTSEYIVERLWREFIDDAPNPHEVVRLAEIFRRSGYEIRPLLKALFMAPAFRAERARGVLIKSPVDVVVGTYRLVGQHPESLEKAEAQMRRMGQDLFDPPNVKGWPGGIAWITATTLSARQQFLTQTAREVVLGAEKGNAKPAMGAINISMGPMPMVSSGWNPLGPDPAVTQRVLLAMAPVDALPANMPPDRRLRQLLIDPAFELK
jgi:uncharacterized protein (DUF1800 family)